MTCNDSGGPESGHVEFYCERCGFSHKQYLY
jgi:hypothetical protein